MKTSTQQTCTALWTALITSGLQIKPQTNKLQLSQQIVQYHRLSTQNLRKWLQSQPEAAAEEEVSEDVTEETEEDNEEVEIPTRDQTPEVSDTIQIHHGTAVEPIGFMLMLPGSANPLLPAP